MGMDFNEWEMIWESVQLDKKTEQRNLELVYR